MPRIKAKADEGTDGRFIAEVPDGREWRTGKAVQEPS